MAINYPIADADLIERLNSHLDEFRKLRVNYVDPSLGEEEQKEIKKVPKKKEVRKKTLIEKFFFSEYE